MDRKTPYQFADDEFAVSIETVTLGGPVAHLLPAPFRVGLVAHFTEEQRDRFTGPKAPMLVAVPVERIVSLRLDRLDLAAAVACITSLLDHPTTGDIARARELLADLQAKELAGR